MPLPQYFPDALGINISGWEFEDLAPLPLESRKLKEVVNRLR